MARPYASFLVRCWRVGDGERRIKVEHIQSGEGTQVATWEAAFAWLGVRSECPPADPASTAERTPAGSDEPAVWRVEPALGSEG